MEIASPNAHREADYPITYRENDAKFIFERVKDKDSTLLISIPAAGKSTFLRFLLYKPSLKEKYLGSEGEKTLLALIDLNELAFNTVNAFFELVCKKILEALEIQKIDIKGLESIRFNQALPYYDQLRSIISILCHQQEITLVFIMDRFDLLCKNFEKPLFNNLKSLRDAFKNKFCYLLASGRDPLQFCELSKIEQLYELVAASIYYLRPLERPDADFVIEQNLKNREIPLAKEQLQIINDFCDGHPGLIKATLQYIDRNYQKLNWEKIKNELREFSGVESRLRKIWQYLTNEEKIILKKIVESARLTNQDLPTLEILEDKGLITRADTNVFYLFCELFADFVQDADSKLPEKIETPRKGLSIDKETKEVYKNGKPLERELSRNEYRLLQHFISNAGKICSREEIVEAVWGSESQEGVSDEALDQVISRLRKKIENDESNPRYIITIRGRGFKFINN